MKNLPADSQPILLRFYNGALFALDTLPVRSQDTLSFKIPEATSPGTLRTILGFPPYAQFSGKGPIFLDFLFNREDIEISLDYQNPQATAQVIHSTENQIYFDFLKSETIYNHKLGLVGQVVMNYPDKDTLLRQSDIITVHLPLNPETKAFIGTNEFALMQPHAVLINTARGPIVSQEALYNALKKGQIAGAAVDVYDQEPPLPLNLELFNAPNLLMLPHMGYATREAFETRLNIVIRNIEMWLNNTPQNQVL